MTLLLHQHRSQEALSHFQQHLASYRHPPPQLAPLPLAVGAAHWGWVGRQYQVMGELMNSRVDPAHLPPQVRFVIHLCLRECIQIGQHMIDGDAAQPAMFNFGETNEQLTLYAILLFS